MKAMKSKCRVCLGTKTRLKDLTDPKNVFKTPETLSLREAFLLICQIRVEESTPARFICGICSKELGTALKFRRKCEKADAEIRNLAEQEKLDLSIKEESLRADDEADLIAGDEEIFVEEVKIECEPSSVVGGSDTEAIKEEVEKNESEKPPPRKRKEPRIRSFSEVADRKMAGIPNVRSSKKTCFKRLGDRQNRSYSCNFCGIEKKKFNRIMQHVEKKHFKGFMDRGGVLVDSEWVRQQLRDGKPLICDFCNEKFGSYVAILKHIRKLHLCK